jgi:hypothetical protein
VRAVRALIVMAGFLAIAGIASAAAPQPTTLVHAPAPVMALAQDGGLLAWLGGDGKKCNSVHLTGAGVTSVLPQPPNAGMTCHWALSNGTVHLALAAGATAALWTLHESRSDFVMTAQVGGPEVEVDRLAHADGTGWWLGGITGGGTTLAYSSVDVEYVDPLACGSGGSCKKKVAGGGIDLVTAGHKTSLPAGPALGLAVSNGRIAYIRATTVAKNGSPTSSPGATVFVRDVPSGAVVSKAKPVGVPLAIGLSPHVLAVLSRNVHVLRLTWFDPATGKKLGGIGVPLQTAPELAVNDQFVVFRFGRNLRALVLARRHIHPLGKTAANYLGLSLDQGRLVWAENHKTYGLIRALPIH